jgi:hypothetical protein
LRYLPGIAITWELKSSGTSAETPAKDAPVTLTADDEIFKRFSAFADEIRVIE